MRIPGIKLLEDITRGSKIVRAKIKGGPLAPDLKGTASFKSVRGGTEVKVKVCGLPPYQAARDGKPPIGPHGFHLHEHGSCEVGDRTRPFQAAGEHWNPTDQPHGNHAGDFPILFSNHGKSRMSFFTDKFMPQDVVGRAVIIHENPDDHRTQPAGAAGRRLACGVIRQ